MGVGVTRLALTISYKSGEMYRRDVFFCKKNISYTSVMGLWSFLYVNVMQNLMNKLKQIISYYYELTSAYSKDSHLF